VHAWPAAQARPHAPQWAASVSGLTHTPLQSVRPAGQAQAPAVQVAPPLHAVPQAPQLSASVRRLTQRPPQST
jgi:hypothetical protein